MTATHHSIDWAAGNTEHSVAAVRSSHSTNPAWLNLIREAVDAADFGTIQIKVHGGKVVQIETTRKIRLPDEPLK
jgi:hypothetical protein